MCTARRALLEMTVHRQQAQRSPRALTSSPTGRYRSILQPRCST
ncbi:MAG: hypothetical protein R3F06_10315 [Nitrosomonas sp.]